MEAERSEPPRGRRTLQALAALASLLGVGLLAAASRGADGRAQDNLPVVAREDVLTGPLVVPARRLGNCGNYPYLKFEKPLYKNLANKGPNNGQGEGLVYQTIDLGAGAGAEYGRKVLIKVHATSNNYKPFSPRMNGMQGKYGSVNLNSGSSVGLQFSFWDQATGKQLTMEELAFTFFDLDTGNGGTSVESVSVSAFKEVHLTQDTEVKVTKLAGGMTKFTASTMGTGKDNPTDPLRLTDQQKNRAVTLMFENIKVIDVTLAATPGDGPRFFTFVARPSLLCAVTVSENSKPPLPDMSYTPPMEVPVAVDDKMTFVRFTKAVGMPVAKGEPVAVVRDANGQEHSLLAPADGKVKALQQGLKPGESCDERLSEKNVVVIAKDKLPALPTETPDAQAAQGKPGETFVEFNKEPGDVVKTGDTIATVEDSATGEEEALQTNKDGVIEAEQTDLKKGDPIEEVEDGNLATLGKFPPLEKAADETASNAPPGSTFVRYLKKEGDLVEQGSSIAVIKGPDGVEKEVKASRAGVVTATQKNLEPGMQIDDVMKDTNLATIGKLPPLKVNDGEEGSNAPPGQWRFVKWKAERGDVVEEGDPIAVVENQQGIFRTVKASKGGTVIERQEHLHPGYEIDQVMKDEDLAVIGKFPAMKAEGMRGMGVDVPNEALQSGAVFKSWEVKDGDHVDTGDTIAKIEIPGAGRRLASGRRLSKSVDIPSPGWGTVTKTQPLKPGQSIADQQVGPTIATIDMGPPWWVGLLGALAALCCCLCCLFAIMKKPKPVSAYTPMPPVEEAPEVKEEPVPEPVPDGLRLDFEDKGEVHTVYAKWRPLGIKHNSVAPIVAHDFTVNSYAKQELGVKDGWKLRRIGDEELHDNSNFGEVNNKLHNYMKDFPLWPLPLEFKEGADSTRTTEIKFVERPIGLEFSNKAPIKVSKIYDGSPAQVQGVKEDWHIVRIGDVNVQENHNFREVMHYFKEGVIPLDDSGKKFS